MRTVFIEPEHRRVTGGPRPVHGQLYPVLHRGILGLAHPEDITGFYRLLHQYIAFVVSHLHLSGRRRLEGLIVRAILFCRLRHEAYV
ncbi:hypothetical protein D9M69_545100 [compost metagenome]